jgi:hypothetical protein
MGGMAKATVSGVTFIKIFRFSSPIERSIPSQIVSA